MVETVDFTKGKVIQPKPSEPKPTINKYQITYKDGRPEEFVEGSLITTTAFFAVGVPREIDMDFRWAAPIAEVHSIRAI